MIRLTVRYQLILIDSDKRVLRRKCQLFGVWKWLSAVRRRRHCRFGTYWWSPRGSVAILHQRGSLSRRQYRRIAHCFMECASLMPQESRPHYQWGMGTFRNAKYLYSCSKRGKIIVFKFYSVFFSLFFLPTGWSNNKDIKW